MKLHNRLFGILGLIIFFACALVGIALFTGLTWANLEGNFYFNYTGGADRKLDLVCPHIITAADSASIVAYIPNKTDRTIAPFVESQISNTLEYQRVQATIEPGETREMRWKVGSEHVAFGHLILMQVYQQAAYKTTTATATCGSLFLNIGFLTGSEVYYLGIAIGLLGMIGGLLLWYYNSRKPGVSLREAGSGMIFLFIIILFGMVISSFGIWILGTLALALAVLLYIIQVSRRFAAF